MASMTKLSTKQLIQERDAAFEALVEDYKKAGYFCRCGHATPENPHAPGCIVAIALGEQR